MRRFALKMGLSSLRQHKRRNLAAGFAIALGYFAILFVMGYDVHLHRYLTVSTIYLQKSGHIAVYKKDGLRRSRIDPQKYSLSIAEQSSVQEFFAKSPQLDFISPYLLGVGLIGNGCKSFPFTGRGFIPANEKRIADMGIIREIIPSLKTVTKGQALWESPNSHQISLAKGLAMRMQKGLRSEIDGKVSLITPKECEGPGTAEALARDASVQVLGRTFDGRNGALDADYVSEYETGLSVTDETALQAPLSFFQELYDTDKVTYLAIFLKDLESVEETLRNLKSKMADQGITIDAYAWHDKILNPSYTYAKSVSKFTVNFVTAIVIGVVFLSILNTLSIGLAEARREIGTLLAIGYNAVEIASIYVVEIVATSVLALIPGGIVTAFICKAAGQLAIPLKFPGFSAASNFQFTPTVLQYVITGVMLLVVAVVTTFVVAKRFASRDILTLLDKGV